MTRYQLNREAPADLKTEAEELSLAGLVDVPAPLDITGFGDLVKSIKPGKKTGFAKIDEHISLHPSEMAIVAARPGHAKTTMLLNLLLKLAEKYDDPIVYFDFETGEIQTVARFLSLLSNHSSREIIDLFRTDNLTIPDDVLEAQTNLKEISPRIYLINRPEYAIRQIEVACQWVKRHTQGNLGAVLVDYIGLVGIEGKASTEELRVAGVVQGLRVIAQKLEVPVIAATQANRSTVEGKFPDLNELRYSGSQEQEASVVLGLKLDKKKGVLGVKILKNRYGQVPLSHVDLEWNPKTGKLSDMLSSFEPKVVAK